MARIARETMAHFRERSVEGVWIHFDVDALVDAIMPAVDYRLPGGLSWAEVETLLHTVWISGLAVGLNVTIFNPRLDTDGHCAEDLVELFVRAIQN